VKYAQDYILQDTGINANNKNLNTRDIRGIYDRRWTQSINIEGRVTHRNIQDRA
jgi:hypothetical protein